MSQSPREIVTACLKFEKPQRMPRDMWVLPWAVDNFGKEVEEIENRFPQDIVKAVDVYDTSKIKGEMFEVGTYIDEWGCVFENIHKGVQGEVRDPILKDIKKWESIEAPYDMLPKNAEKARAKVNEFCANTDKFVISPWFARPWERLQFLRGTENAMMDVMTTDECVTGLLKKIHDFFMKEIEFWVSTDIDAIWFMDDWGSQTSLLIPPRVWKDIFKPFYKDYCDLAHSNDKFIFMHSDGNIIEICEDLVEAGVDAINSQLFCMDMEKLAEKVKGKITFWGEIDRQHVLISENPQDGRNAVRKVAEHLYDPAGGVIAQLEFGPGANPETITAVYEEWEKVQQEIK